MYIYTKLNMLSLFGTQLYRIYWKISFLGSYIVIVIYWKLGKFIDENSFQGNY